MKKNLEASNPSDSRRQRDAGIIIGAIVLLLACWALVLPAIEGKDADNAMEKMRPTLNQAQTRLVENFSDGDFSRLDNEVLRQVAFPGMGRPVGPDQPLQIRGGLMGLSAIPVNEGKGFALIVDYADDRECKALLELYPNNPAQVNSRPVDQSSGKTPCRPKRNEVRMDFMPPFSSSAETVSTHVPKTH